MKKKLLMMASALLLAAGTLFAAQGLTADLPGSGMADVYGIGSKLTKGNVGGFVPRYVAAPPRVHNLTEHTQFLPLPRAGVQNVAPERLAATPVVQGYVIYSDFWSTIGASEYGYYDIPLNGSLLNSLFISNYSMNGGGCVVDGTLHGVYYYNGGQSVFVLHYDLATGQMTATEASIGAIALDMAADPLTGDIYGCFYTDDAQNFCLGKLNPTTGERTKIYQLTTGDDDADMAWNACAIDGNGQLYAINQAGKLYRVDKESGSMRLIGATGVTPGYLSSACIDPVTGDMYWSVMTTDVQGFLYKVDKSTGAATLIE